MSLMKHLIHSSVRLKSLPSPEWSNILQVLSWRSVHTPFRTAFYELNELGDITRSINYLDLYQNALKLACTINQLTSQNQHHGLLSTAFGIDYIIGFFGGLLAGKTMVPTPALTKRKSQFLDHLIKDSESTFAIIDSKSQTLFTAIQPSLQTVLINDLSPNNIEIKLPASEMNAYLQYSSGSTGNPKGVQVTHHNLLMNQYYLEKCYQTSSSTPLLSWLPMYHDLGLSSGMLLPIFSGSPCYLMRPEYVIQKPERWLQALARYKIYGSGGPNFIYDLCVEKVNPSSIQGSLKHWKAAYNGAEPIFGSSLDSFHAQFQNCGFNIHSFCPSYGLAEASLFVSAITPNQALHRIWVSTHHLERHQIVHSEKSSSNSKELISCGIVDESVQIVSNNKACKANHIGEIWVSGPQVGLGYWNKPDINDKQFNQTIAGHNESYLRTGDLGFIDHNNHLYITGRIKDLIILNGKNYYPTDIESSLKTIPCLIPNSIAAITCNNEQSEALVIIAEVDRHSLKNFDVQKISNQINQRCLECHQIQPNHILFMKPGQMLKTSSGKIKRQAIKKAFESEELLFFSQWSISSTNNNYDHPSFEANDQQLSTEELAIQHEITTVLISILNQSVSDTAFHKSSIISSNTINSLTAVDIQSELESIFDVDIPFSLFAEPQTCHQLASFIHHQLKESTTTATYS